MFSSSDRCGGMVGRIYSKPALAARSEPTVENLHVRAVALRAPERPRLEVVRRDANLDALGAVLARPARGRGDERASGAAPAQRRHDVEIGDLGAAGLGVDR